MPSALAFTRRPILCLSRIGLPARAAAAWASLRSSARSSARPAAVARLAERGCERLVLFLPVLILPTVGTPGDLLLLATLFVLVAALEAALWPLPGRVDAADFGALDGALARPGAGLVLAVGLVLGVWQLLGVGAALALALFILVRAIESRVPTAFWPIGVALAALACALLLDLALVGLGLERGVLWPALAAAIGTAGAAARQLEGCAADSGRSTLDAAALAARDRALSEALLVAALALVLALYAALLAHAPTLGLDADSRYFLTLPFLAAALVRLARLALDRNRPATADSLATVLLATFATAGISLGSAPF